MISIFAKRPKARWLWELGKCLSRGRSRPGIPGSVFWELREGAGRKGPLPLNQGLPSQPPWKLVSIPATGAHQEMASEVRTVAPWLR